MSKDVKTKYRFWMMFFINAVSHQRYLKFPFFNKVIVAYENSRSCESNFHRLLDIFFQVAVCSCEIIHYFKLHYTTIDYLGIEYDVISTREYQY